MHPKQHAILGGWLASQSDQFLRGRLLELTDQTDYWVHSRTRFERWHAALKMFHADLTEPQPEHDPWPAIEAVVQEIVYTELLTRVWAALLDIHDARRGQCTFSGIARGTFVGHVEVRNRAWQLLLRARDEHQIGVIELHRLINRIARWTDLWLSLIDPVDRSSRFAFDPSRVNDFQLESNEGHRDQAVDLVSRTDEAALMMTSFNSALQREPARHSANPDLNHQIALGVMSAVPLDRFASMSGPDCTWRLKLEQSHLQAQALIDQLIAPTLATRPQV